MARNYRPRPVAEDTPVGQPPQPAPDYLQKLAAGRTGGYLNEQALLRHLNQQRLLRGERPALSLDEAIGGGVRGVTQTPTPGLQLDPRAFAGRPSSAPAQQQQQGGGGGLGGIDFGGILGALRNLTRGPRGVPRPAAPGPAATPGPPSMLQRAPVPYVGKEGQPSPAAPAEIGPGAATSNAYLAQQRAPFAKQLQDPGTRKLLGAIISAENPGAGPAVAESLFNRTEFVNEQRAARGQAPLSLKQMILGDGKNSFYGPVRTGAINSHLAKMDDPKFAAQMNARIDQALGGSNVTRGHTDQGSRGDPNYERGGIGVNINGERFNDWGVQGAKEWRLRREAQVSAKGGQPPGPELKGEPVPYLPSTEAAIPTTAAAPAATPAQPPQVSPGAPAQPQAATPTPAPAAQPAATVAPAPATRTASVAPQPVPAAAPQWRVAKAPNAGMFNLGGHIDANGTVDSMAGGRLRDALVANPNFKSLPPDIQRHIQTEPINLNKLAPYRDKMGINDKLAAEQGIVFQQVPQAKPAPAPAAKAGAQPAPAQSAQPAQSPAQTPVNTGAQSAQPAAQPAPPQPAQGVSNEEISRFVRSPEGERINRMQPPPGGQPLDKQLEEARRLYPDLEPMGSPVPLPPERPPAAQAPLPTQQQQSPAPQPAVPEGQARPAIPVWEQQIPPGFGEALRKGLEGYNPAPGIIDQLGEPLPQPSPPPPLPGRQSQVRGIDAFAQAPTPTAATYDFAPPQTMQAGFQPQQLGDMLGGLAQPVPWWQQQPIDPFYAGLNTGQGTMAGFAAPDVGFGGGFGGFDDGSLGGMLGGFSFGGLGGL